MSTIKEAATDFLSCRRIAVTGVSREPKEHGGNIVYTRLKERGYDVFAVNPNTDVVEGDRAYPDLSSIPGGVEAVVIATRPEHAEATVREAANLGMTKVWMHRSMGGGSVSPPAVSLGRELRHGRHRRRLPADVRPHRRRRPQGDVRPAEADRQGAAARLAGFRGTSGYVAGSGSGPGDAVPSCALTASAMVSK